MDVKVSLPDELSAFIERGVASGRYSSASDVVSSALRLLELRDEDAAKLEWLRNAYREGIESGDAGEIDFEEIKARGRAMLETKAAE